MRSTNRNTFRSMTLFAAAIVAAHAAADARAAVTPYVTDADTLHLYHFDEVANPAADSAGSMNLTLNGGAAFGGAAFSGFGTSMTVAAALSDDNRADGSQDIAPAGNVAHATTGAFTFEALVRPTIALGSVSDNMQIISLEQDGAGARSFQFRIAAGTQSLQFLNIAGGGSPAAFLIPTTGKDAYAVGEWFHVAVTYDGNAGGANNFRYYWTRVTDDVTRANLIGVSSMGADLAGGGDFAVGNEARDTSEDGWVGNIDETRISNSVRAADQFLFSKTFPNVIILSDHFNTASAGLNSDLAARQSGMAATTTYTQSGTGSATIGSNQLTLDATSPATSLAVSPDLDLAAGAIGTLIAGNSFVIDVDVNPVSDSVDGGDLGTDGDWFAISFGHTAASRNIGAGSDTAVTDALADFGILFRDNGLFQVFDNGANVLGDTVYDANPVATETYNLRLLVETTGAASGAALVSAFVNGVQIDLNGVAAGLRYAFIWDANGTNYISLEARTNASTFDNLVIATVPAPAALPAGLALLALGAARGRRRRRR